MWNDPCGNPNVAVNQAIYIDRLLKYVMIKFVQYSAEIGIQRDRNNTTNGFILQSIKIGPSTYYCTLNWEYFLLYYGKKRQVYYLLIYRDTKTVEEDVILKNVRI